MIWLAMRTTIRHLKLMRIVFLAALVVIGLVPVTSIPHQGATGPVKARMDAMGEVSRNAKLLGLMAKSGAVDPLAASEASQRLRQHAAEMPSLFEERMFEAPSEALPEIWENWADFVAKAEAMDTAAILIEAAGADPEAFAQAVQRLGQSCTACHELYRLKQ